MARRRTGGKGCSSELRDRRLVAMAHIRCWADALSVSARLSSKLRNWIVTVKVFDSSEALVVILSDMARRLAGMIAGGRWRRSAPARLTGDLERVQRTCASFFEPSLPPPFRRLSSGPRRETRCTTPQGSAVTSSNAATPLPHWTGHPRMCAIPLPAIGGLLDRVAPAAVAGRTDAPDFPPDPGRHPSRVWRDTPVERGVVHEREHEGRLPPQVMALPATTALVVNIVFAAVTRIVPGASFGHLRGTTR